MTGSPDTGREASSTSLTNNDLALIRELADRVREGIGPTSVPAGWQEAFVALAELERRVEDELARLESRNADVVAWNEESIARAVAAEARVAVLTNGLRRILTLVAQAAETGTRDPLLDTGMDDSEAVARIGGIAQALLGAAAETAAHTKDTEEVTT